MTPRQWVATGLLSAAALVLGRFLPIALPWSDPVLAVSPFTATVAAFAAVPYLLAGMAINVPAAIIVGLFGGLARAIGQTQAPVDVAGVALVAGAAALLMRQNYSGRLFAVLRQPPLAGGLSQMLLSLVAGLHILTAITPNGGILAAVDMALYIGAASLLPLFIEGIVGGGMVFLVPWIVPHWSLPLKGTVPSPLRRSLHGQIVGTFLTFASIVVLLTTIVAFYLSTQSIAKAAVEQMTQNVDAAALRVGALKSDLSVALAEYSTDDRLLSADPVEKRGAVSRVQRALPQFSAIQLIDGSGTVLATTAVAESPSLFETQLVAEALAGNQSRMVAAEQNGEKTVLLAVPTYSETEQVVLLGQLAANVWDEIAELLPGADEVGSSLIVDDRASVVLHSGAAAAASLVDNKWEIPATDQLFPVTSRIAMDRAVYQTVDETTGTRQFLYFTSVPGSGWKIAATLPHAAILQQSLGILGPLALVLLAICLVFFVSVSTFGRNISRPLADVAMASKAIAVGGGLERPVRSEREDEIGQLSQAFSQMQRALKQRLDELSLLLGVSNQVASTVNLSEGMSAVLKGTLRGTGATGGRAVVRNPITPGLLTFAEGPMGDALAELDRAVIAWLRQETELTLSNPQEITTTLSVENPPVAALYAVALRSAGEFQGAMFIGYRQPHYFDKTELNLLRTIAGQASVLVQKAHLFTAAESGRRRLAAILASTTNAVIVTDQTDRVLLLNPAMERTLGIKADEVIGQSVVEVVPISELARRLSMGMSAARKEFGPVDAKLELEAGGRSYLANIAAVQGVDGQAMGRVAVLQDVTDFVEVDRLKSEFLEGISHDLKSPLTYMHNYAGMLPLEEDPKLQREYIDKIIAGIDRMSLLVNDLVEMAQIQAGINLQFDQIQMVNLLEDVVSEYASPALMQGVRLEVVSDADLPSVLGDATLLRRAISNYLTNGLKHAPQSGTMTLSATQKGNEIIISVHDNGPGISFVDQAHLFEKFYRGHKAAGNTRGSGLGLSIVKSIADHHQGQVWCESRLGHGSTFYLSLPVAESKPVSQES